MKILILFSIGLLAVAGAFLPRDHTSPLWDDIKPFFGSTNFPTSLDTLTNPAGTDSVATVSHSGQHSNANDAIEAIEAKLGTGASTAVTNSIFAGNGAGTSLWTTYATGTNFTATGIMTSTGLGTFGGLLSTASSTIVGGLTITGNSTTTNATSTIGAFTTHASSTKYFGAGLDSCSGSSFLQWTSGFFGCAASSGGVVINRTAATSSPSTTLTYII